jgi:hypothetical protein
MLDGLNVFRKRVPFWWWLVYDWLIAVGIVAMLASWHGWPLLLPAALGGCLIFSLFLDAVEFAVKRRV